MNEHNFLAQLTMAQAASGAFHEFASLAGTLTLAEMTHLTHTIRYTSVDAGRYGTVWPEHMVFLLEALATFATSFPELLPATSVTHQ
jgi:hypothetical protein